MHETHTVCECAKCGGKFTPLGGAVVEEVESAPEPPDKPFANRASLEPFDRQDHSRDDGFGTRRSSLPRREPPEEWEEGRRFDRGSQQSGLGMASFIIALLVGGLDIILAVVVAANIARPVPKAQKVSFSSVEESAKRVYIAAATSENVESKLMAGGMAMVFLNCISIPLCLVGVGLALVGLIAYRDRNHLLTRIGLYVNRAVILGVIGLYLLEAMFGG